MTIAEFDFKLNLGMQLFYNKFKCNPRIIYIDSKTYKNITSNHSHDDYYYKYKEYNYKLEIYVQSNIQDYLELYIYENKTLCLIGINSETRY